MHPCPSPFNLADDVLTAGRATPDKIALAVLGPAGAERWRFARLEGAVRATAGGLRALGPAGAERWRFARLEGAVRATAGGLRALGLAPGARVLLRLGNDAHFPVAFLGAIAAGLVPVPTAQALSVAELDTMVPLIAPGAILAAPGVTLPTAPRCMVISDLGALMSGPMGDFVMGDPDRPAFIVFTSGSSGRPKPVVHAHRAIWARRMMWDGWYGLTPDDRVLHAGAFNWTFTLGTGLLDPWAIGATALIPTPGTPPEALALLLKRHDATIFAAVPGVFRKLLKSGAALDLPKLRHGLSAGEKLPQGVRQQWHAATGRMIHEALGMSECSTFISGSPARPAPADSLGYPQPGRRIAVLDPAGTPLPKGETGILAIHRDDPGLMLGYLGPDGVPALPLLGEWFATGDLVREMPDGALSYHGRHDDILTTGGYRIAPLEIEAAFHDAAGLVDCAATALPVKADTEVLALAYCGTTTPEALATLAQARLARYKQPRLYLPLAALPRSANGKLDRKALVALLKDRS